MRSLQSKIVAATIVVAIVAVVVVAVAARQATDAAFTAYVQQNQTQRLQRVQADLADYYARYQSWANVQTFLESSAMGLGMGRMMGQTMGMGRAGTVMGADQQTLLADGQGVVVATIGAAVNSQRLSEREMSAALPITTNGRTVGYLLGQGPGLSSFSALEHQFVDTVNRALILASIIAGAVAVVIGLFLARRLTGPLASMTKAVQAMAGGNLTQRVQVTSDDEVARLAGAFNTMSASLAHAEELRRNLVADVAHELRTPIAVLRADLEALHDGVYAPTPERMAALREETDLLARLVSDLHELSLAEAGRLALERRPTDLVQLCQQIIGAMSSQAATRGVSLVMAQAADEVVSMVDHDRIGQVLRNLIGNALRYTPAGGSVTLECRAENKKAVIVVRDSGTGIKPEDLPHVFNRFYRGEKSRARATGGAGLGLAIVKNLVEAHGGAVSVESTPGQGATFHISLPLEKE
jgi:two-component system OmpR family sensor kinase/two-component system sensor histidine kinase BaeS